MIVYLTNKTHSEMKNLDFQVAVRKYCNIVKRDKYLTSLDPGVSSAALARFIIQKTRQGQQLTQVKIRLLAEIRGEKVYKVFNTVN